MFLSILFAIVGVTLASSRDFVKPLRSLPTVSNSLVNLGKLDISFYFNSKPQDVSNRNSIQEPISSLLKPCPCSEFDNVQDSVQRNPFDLLDKIMNNRDIFPSQTSHYSPQCCDSHEPVHEDILVEFAPNKTPKLLNSIFPSIPAFPSEFLMNKPRLPSMPLKKKAIEIFLFPKRKDVAPAIKNKASNKIVKKDIQVVGGKEIHNEFKNVDFALPVPLVNNNINDNEKPAPDNIKHREDTTSNINKN